jgi:hypothetical protein
MSFQHVEDDEPAEPRRDREREGVRHADGEP